MEEFFMSLQKRFAGFKSFVLLGMLLLSAMQRVCIRSDHFVYPLHKNFGIARRVH